MRPELPPTATNAPVLKGPTQAAAHDGRRSGLDSKFMSMAIIEHASLVNEDAEAERKAAAAAAKAAADGPRNPLEGEETALSATDFRGKALGCLGLTNPVRAACISVCLNPWFDRVTLAAILGSSIALAVDNPLNDPRSAMGLALAYLDYVWTVYFAVEMVVKVVALGFWFESEKVRPSTLPCYRCRRCPTPQPLRPHSNHPSPPGVPQRRVERPRLRHRRHQLHRPRRRERAPVAARPPRAAGAAPAARDPARARPEARGERAHRRGPGGGQRACCCCCCCYCYYYPTTTTTR